MIVGANLFKVVSNEEEITSVKVSGDSLKSFMGGSRLDKKEFKSCGSRFETRR